MCLLANKIIRAGGVGMTPICLMFNLAEVILIRMTQLIKKRNTVISASTRETENVIFTTRDAHIRTFLNRWFAQNVSGFA